MPRAFSFFTFLLPRVSGAYGKPSTGVEMVQHLTRTGSERPRNIESYGTYREQRGRRQPGILLPQREVSSPLRT